MTSALLTLTNLGIMLRPLEKLQQFVNRSSGAIQVNAFDSKIRFAGLVSIRESSSWATI